ncbi:TPA: thymidylate kinase [Candidatus Berkelbacteria bacterium]|uniref:Thymidylate kinase n=1 Tax=Berkelbacteria bacterium GW2011_GWE1_39_12 TaxID=1618337 RepID=A0A0G4B6C2_9BACT|nr:MAG: thymidylate kinase, dTMP kinase [Berkelbacteria bacterium GW2011_GWE1_39_12]HBO60349.1 thymidylate kinase [Candidatus Berkelbacteria bacterium]
MKGKFIVIEGTDGSGKGTQVKLLIDHLKKKKKKVFLADFPRYETFFGKMVGRYLNGEFGDVKQASPYLVSLTYAMDRAGAKNDIEKHLKMGHHVIANRYTFSNMAHQSANLPPKERKKYIKWNEELEYVANGIPKEDLIVFLHVPTKFTQDLVDKKEKRNYTSKKRDIHEANKDHLFEAEKQYLWLSKHYSHVRRLNCINKKGELRTIEDIHQEIIALLQNEKLI